MTKQEAIEILNWIPTKGDEVDAMEMAIEALKYMADEEQFWSEQYQDIDDYPDTDSDAIRYLDGLRSEITDTGSYEYNYLTMAIEALQRGLENVNADSCSEKPNRSEPKTAESGSVDSEMPEIKTDRTTSGDLIRRQDAIYYVKQATIGETDVMKAWVKAQTHLMRLPSAQPERERGKWIIKDNPGTGWYRVTCSECGEDVTSTAPCIGFYPNAKVIWDYCPDCGADMREVDDERPD